MSANGISTLPNKQAKQLAKLDIAQAKRQGYATIVENTTAYTSVFPPTPPSSNTEFAFGYIKITVNNVDDVYLHFNNPVPAISDLITVGMRVTIDWDGRPGNTVADIASTLIDFPGHAWRPDGLGFLLSIVTTTELPGNSEDYNIEALHIPNGTFTGSGIPDTTAPFYRQRNVYDITQLPTEYSGSGNGLIDNPNTGGLIEGRPWISFAPAGSDPTGLDGYLTFNGTNQYLATPGSADYNVGSGDFTVEWVQYQTGGGSHPRVFSIGTDTSASLGVSIESGTLYVWFAGSVGTSVAMPAWYMDGRWLHVAIARSGTSLKVLFNGQVAQTATNSSSVNNSTDQLTIGADINPSGGYWSYFPGRLSNFRWTRSAVYTGEAFSLTAPLTELPETKLLLLMTTDGTKYTDSATEAHVMTATGAPVWSAF